MKTTLFSLAVLVGLFACRDELHPLTPPKDPVFSSGSTTSCQAPPIEKNIIGTWRFEISTPDNQTRTGTVTFDAQKNIIDPDSLFENTIDIGGTVTTKTYNPTDYPLVPNPTQTYFAVYLLAKKGRQINYYTVLLNECTKVHMGFGNQTAGFKLTRL